MPAEPAVGIGEIGDTGELDAVGHVGHPLEHAEEPGHVGAIRRGRHPAVDPLDGEGDPIAVVDDAEQAGRRHARRERTEHGPSWRWNAGESGLSVVPAALRKTRRPSARSARTAGPGEKPPATSCVATTGDPSTRRRHGGPTAGTSATRCGPLGAPGPISPRRHPGPARRSCHPRSRRRSAHCQDAG